MSFLRKTSGKGKVGAAAAALMAVIAGMVAFAAPASAHHSNIDASATCITGEGGWRVTWTASTWSSSLTEGAHPAILVEYSTSSSSGPWTTVPNDSSAMPYADGAATPMAGLGVFRGSAASSFTGTIDLPPSASDQSVWVRALPVDVVPASGPWFWDDNFFGSDGGTALDTRADGFDLTWLNGNDSLDGETTNKITLKGGDCQPPAEPSAELANECATKDGATGITILLENTGGTSATFDVAGVGDVVVAAHDDTTVFVPVAEDAAYSVAVTVGGDPVPGSPIAGTRDCLSPNPSAELADECATDQAGAPGISILLENTGTQGVTFDVEGVGSVAVGAGAQTTVFVAVAEDAAYSIDVKVGGQHVPGSPIAGTRDCLTAEPSAELADECAVSDDVEGITITLANTGDQGVTFNVEGLGDVVVGPDDSETVFVAVDENSSYSIDVIALGAHVPGSPINGTRDCRSPEPSAGLDDECATLRGTEGVSITLTNDGDDDATFQVDGGDDVVVGAGESTTVFVPVDENSAYSIEVTSGGQTVATFEGTRDCRHGVASLSLADVCAVVEGVEGLELTLTNTGDDDLSFQVDGGDDLVVGAGASRNVFVPIPENTAYAVSVTALGETVGLLEGLRDCRQPDVSVELGDECAEGGVEILVANTGDDDATVEVDGEPVDVAAGTEVSVIVEVEENGEYAIDVTFGGETIGTFEGTRNCETEFSSIGSSGDCVSNIPVFSWSITVDRPDPAHTVTIRWFDLDGNLQLTQSGLPLTGETVWPGAVVGSDGVAVDWPGWLLLEDGTWVEGDDGFLWARPSVRITFEVNPTSDPVEVAYPPAQPECTDPPPSTTTTLPTEVGGVQNPQPLPRTGSESSRSLVVGLALLISGAGVVLLAADRRRAASR